MIYDDSNEYPFCPEPFRLNCASYEVKCSECGGCTEEGSLEYIPIERSVELAKKKHPYLLHQKKSKKDIARKKKLAKRSTETSKLVKKALKSERNSLKSIGAKGTIASGRFTQEGDGIISINDIKYYIEVKTRYSDNASMFPTSAEWKKALSQGCKLFLVESDKGNTVTMSKETFMEILGL
jgi:hypothetical protein